MNQVGSGTSVRLDPKDLSLNGDKQCLEWLSPRQTVRSLPAETHRARAPAQGNAIRHGLMIATRDTGPFVAAGLTVISPWTAQH